MGIYVKEENQPWNHKQIAGNATGDNALDATSDNNIKNKVVAAKLGDTDISDIGDGTVTGAISQVNSDLGSKSSASTVTGDDAFSKIATLKNYVDSKHEIVTVTGVQGDTYKTLLNKVWNAIDMDKIRPGSTLKLANNPPANMSRVSSNQVQGTIIGTASNGVTFYTMMIQNGTSGARQFTLTTSGLTVTDISNTVVNAAKIYIEY